MFSVPMVKELSILGSSDEYIRLSGKKVSNKTRQALFRSFCKVRIHFDFEFWAYTCVVIKDKETSKDIPFKLNRGQRKFLARLEKRRIAKEPIRICLCKSRQWGGSTLTQIYMAWIQIEHVKNWNSVIIAQQENTARTIKGMYSDLISKYPSYLCKGGRMRFTPYMGSQKTSIIRQRGCRVTIGTAEKPDALRGEHMCMAHISEYGIWKTTDGKSPEDTMQSIIGGIHIGEYTLIVVESTAKGVGNPFHRMWLNAMNPQSGSPYEGVFIAWFDVDMNSSEIQNYEEFVKSLSDYEKDLFKLHEEVTLEALKWRRMKLAELEGNVWRLKSEYPSTPEEAFESTGNRVFPAAHVSEMRKRNREPSFIGEVACRAGENKVGREAMISPIIYEKEKGNLKVWAMPPSEKRVSNRFVIGVDIGGRSDKSDYSVITVLDRYYMIDNGVPEVAARWRGHCDHDIMIWKAVQLSILYNNALLVIESNTLEAEQTEGSHGEYIFDEIAEYYSSHLYSRISAQDVRDKIPPKWGFQTNKQTKPFVIDNLISALREGGYIERDVEACNEMDTYEIDEKGAYNAKEGCHDDIIMSTGIALVVAYDFRRYQKPAFIPKEPDTTTNHIEPKGAADY